eukprot:299107-Pyramimonas_sp.AAC.1
MRDSTRPARSYAKYFFSEPGGARAGSTLGKAVTQNEDYTEITISQAFSAHSIQLTDIATERRT